MPSKLVSLQDAVARFVDDGDSVYAGYLCVPFALTHEIVRQGKKDLEVVGASVVWPGTELVMAGACRRIRSGYMSGALRPGDFTSLMESGELQYEDYSNQAIALMLMAGALGVPFMPTRTFLGTDYLSPALDDHPGSIPGYKRLHEMESPFNGEKVVLLPAICPDVVIMHAQRADIDGNVQMWGHMGDARWGLWAGRKVIVTVDEIVDSEVIRSDPDRTVLPAFKVSAVVHWPYGAHPGGLAGHYDFDYAFIGRALAAGLNSFDGFATFRADWIDGLGDSSAYVAKVRGLIGDDAFNAIAVQKHIIPKVPVDYGYSRTLNLPLRQGEPPW